MSMKTLFQIRAQVKKSHVVVHRATLVLCETETRLLWLVGHQSISGFNDLSHYLMKYTVTFRSFPMFCYFSVFICLASDTDVNA